MTNEEIVRWVIQTFEGKFYTDDPFDTGGATKFGITLRTLDYYRKKYLGLSTPTTKLMVQQLTLEDAVDIGLKVFMHEYKINLINDWRTRLIVYDYCFHSGWKQAIGDFQKAVRTSPDGKIGPLTLAAEKSFGSNRLLLPALRTLTFREEFMQQIMLRKHTQRKWMLGWWIRTTKLQRLVLLEE